MYRLASILCVAVLLTGCATRTISKTAPAVLAPPPPVAVTPGDAERTTLLQLAPVTDQVLWSTDDKGRIRRSTDGGRSWKTIASSKGTAPPSLVALDADHAWFLSEGELHVTSDGGGSWQERPTPFPNGLLSFSDPEHGWALVTEGVAAGSQAVKLYQTSDGGTTWTAIADARPDGKSAIPFAGLKNGMTFLDQRKGWLVLDQPVGGRVSLLYTWDGGLSWNVQSVPIDPAYQQAFLYTYPPHFVDQKIGFLAVAVNDGSAESRFVLYRTEDGGDTWRPQSGVSRLLPRFSSATRGWALENGKLFTTADGGASWTEVTEAP